MAEPIEQSRTTSPTSTPPLSSGVGSLVPPSAANPTIPRPAWIPPSATADAVGDTGAREHRVGGQDIPNAAKSVPPNSLRDERSRAFASAKPPVSPAPAPQKLTASSLATGRPPSAKPALSETEGLGAGSGSPLPSAKPIAPPPPPMVMPGENAGATQRVARTPAGQSAPLRPSDSEGQTTEAPLGAGSRPESVPVPTPEAAAPVEAETLEGPTGLEEVATEEVVELPELTNEAIAFLTSKYYAGVTEDAAKTFELSADDLTFLNEMDHMVLGGSLTVAEYVAALRGEFPQLDAKKKEELIARLVAERFMPWGDALTPSAQTVAKDEKLVFPSVPYYAVYVKPLTYGGAAGEVARMAGIGLAGTVRERIRDLIVSKVKGIRIDAQIEEQLVRPADFGGIGLSKEQARSAVDAMNDILKRARVVTEEEYSAWLADDMRRKTEAEKPSVALPPAGEDEDGAEIAAISSRMARPVRDTASVLALSTETILKRLSQKPTDEYLAKRLENIVNTRLRDVRSRSEVLMKLMRDSKVGGIGVERKEAEKLADQIEEGYKEFHEIIAQEEKEKLGVQLKDQERKIEERKKREAEEHARWFEERVKVKQVEDETQKKMVERMRVVAQGLTTPIQIHPIDLKEEKKEKAAFGELVPAPVPMASTVAAPKSSAVPPASPAAAEKSAAAFAPVGAKPSVLPPSTAPAFKSVVKVSAETAKAAAASVAERPRVEDVKVVRTHLSGPVQEIGNLTLATFRRMGKTPVEAAMRIQQKVDLLAQESFERRVEAIQAWQASPLQKVYVSLVAEAFSTGTPMSALVEKKRAAGENAPTNEELAAIVEMNGKLRL